MATAGLLAVYATKKSIDANFSSQEFVGNLLRPVLGEGNFLQRTGTLGRLTTKLTTQPTPENNALFSAWLKMNAAEFWLQNEKGSILPATCIKHYLYGGGEPLDISALFADAAIRAQKIWLGGTQWIHSEHADGLSNFFEYTTNRAFHTYGSEGVQVKEAPSTVLENNKKRLRMILWPPYESRSFDIQTSIGRYTLVASGDISQTTDDTDITSLEKVKVTINDVYDFITDDKKKVLDQTTLAEENVGMATMEILRKIGINNPANLLLQSLGKDRFTQFINLKVGFNDKEGFLLAEQGFAKPYDITANFSLPEKLTLSIPDKFLPPELQK